MIRRTLASVFVVAFSAIFSLNPASAQMIDEAPREVRVTREHAEVRCGWGSDAWYSVGRAPGGTLLTADGREGDWLRVRYPEGLGFGVLVRASDVEMDEGGETATLTRAARPIHRNRQSPASGSWMKLTGEPFGAGTTFDVVDTIESEGETVFVLVEAPERVRGYVRAADVEAVAGDAAAAPGSTESQDADAGSEPADDAPEAETTPADTAGDDVDPSSAGEIGEGDDAPETATPEQLYAAYEAIVREPLESAEIEPLIEEYRSVLTAGDLDSADVPRLTSRLQLLEIRLDLQRDLRAVENATERASRERETIDRLVGDWRSRPAYTVVGRLMASTLYDGRRLPLMYRLQSLDGPGGRTIAYILPDDELDLDAKLGGVVGIVGETRRDRTIRVRMVEPVQVDVLEPGE